MQTYVDGLFYGRILSLSLSLCRRRNGVVAKTPVSFAADMREVLGSNLDTGRKKVLSEEEI